MSRTVRIELELDDARLIALPSGELVWQLHIPLDTESAEHRAAAVSKIRAKEVSTPRHPDALVDN